MRKLVHRCWLIAVLALPLSGQNDAWKKYDSATGNFSVLLPGEPQDTLVQKGEGMQSRALVVQDKTVRYNVIYSSLDREQVVDEKNFQEYKKGVLNQLPICEVAAEQQPSPALEGFVGHWYKLTCSSSGNKITIEGNLYTGKHHAYAVLAIFPASAQEPPSVKKFTGSFSILTPGK